MSLRRQELLLLLGGFNLMVLQFMMMRTGLGIVFGEEIAVFLVALSYFLGHSVGYLASGRIRERGLRRFAWTQWATQLALPFFPRWLASLLPKTGSPWIDNLAALSGVLALCGLWTTSFYATLLPILLASRRESDFPRCFAAEIAGALLGCAAVYALAGSPPVILMTLYQVVFCGLFCLLLEDPASRALCAAACLLYAAAFGPLERASVAALYRRRRGVPVARVLQTANTRHQRLEILEGASGERYLFLDGVRHFGGPDLSEYNYFIAGLPAALLPGAEAAIAGSGSFGAVREALKSARRVTSVELDEAVSAAGLRWLSGGVPAAPERWTIVNEDVKHYLGRLEAPLDLLAMDVAGPYRTPLALLYTREFYGLARSRLKPGGAISVCLNDSFSLGGYRSSRIAATLMSVFKEVFVIDRGAGRSSFAIAGDRLPFARADIERELRQGGRPGAVVLDRADIERRITGGARPISTRGIDIVIPLIR